MSILGGDRLRAELERIARSMAGSVDVGFMAGATYPDGESVPQVAAQNEYGVPSNNQPPRPFFRRMIEEEGPTWPGKIAAQARLTNYDGALTLARVGIDVRDALKVSINEFVSPALSEVTIERKGFEKPLIETTQMIQSVTVRMNDQ